MTMIDEAQEDIFIHTSYRENDRFSRFYYHQLGIQVDKVTVLDYYIVVELRTRYLLSKNLAFLKESKKNQANSFKVFPKRLQNPFIHIHIDQFEC